MTTALRRPAAVLIAAAALAGGFAGTADAESPADDVIVSAPYAADSGDDCPMGATRGKLGWHVPGQRIVEVTGAVLDHPLATDPNTRCREDGRFTVATFSAFAKNVPLPLDADSVAVNNGTSGVRLQLTATRPIDFVVVQVCRRTLFAGPAEICGRPVRVPVPVVTLP